MVVVWSDDASEQYDEILDLIIGHSGNGLQRARKLNEAIVDSLSLLEANPRMGKKLRLIYRYIIVGRYRLTYYYDETEDMVWIMTMFHVNFQHFDHPRNLHLPDKN